MFRKLFQFFIGAVPQEAVPGGDVFFENDGDDPEGDADESNKETPAKVAPTLNDEEAPAPAAPKATKSVVSDDDVVDESENPGESDGPPDPSGEGAGNDGGAEDVVALALRSSIRARLMSQKSLMPAKDAEKFIVSMPSVESLMNEIPDLKDVDSEDVKRIHAIAAAVVKQAVSTFYEGTTKPFVESLRTHNKQQKSQENVTVFMKKYPNALKDDATKKAMLAVYDEIDTEFGRDLAESVSLEELYLASGAKGQKAATRATKGIVSKVAEQQKEEAIKASTQTDRVARVRTGVPSKRDPEEDVRKTTFDHIRRTTFQPFVIRPRSR